jgi:DNA replication and repair protein RecF
MVKKIRLANFRNFEDKVLSFSSKNTIIVGPNASGKTNVLEALFLLSTGKSFKARVEEEMVKKDAEICRVKAKIDDDITLEVLLTRGGLRSENIVKPVPRKRLLINDIGKRLLDFAGSFKVVLFSPEDLSLITESPSVRRKFLDTALSQVDREYRRSLIAYEKGLRRRNKLLFRIREEGISRTLLTFWDKLIIKNGDYLSSKREEFVDFINGSSWIGTQFEIVYDKSGISEARLAQYAHEEVAAATTLVGPHRDDIVFTVKNGKDPYRELAPYGSRGEQRMGVLWAKIAEVNYIERITGQKPTLLLDDIFSELDHEHRDLVLEVAEGTQTIITTADPHFVVDLAGVERIEL